jgi:Holliday junction resolvase RusA-like endonuclease
MANIDNASIDNASMDNVIDLCQCQGGSDSACSFVIFGNPRPLPRMRHFRRGFYNPAKEAMDRFGANVKRQVPLSQHGIVFPKETALTVKVTFFMKRPNIDFVGSKRLNCTLKSRALQPSNPSGPDIDNLCKFLLDVLTGIVYFDDKQVVNLIATKKKDSDGCCCGKTEVEIFEYKEEPRLS